jgi:flavin-dependent dehydrogenase
MSAPGAPRPTFQGVDYDVVVAGGGLAGLCLAKQLRNTDPALTVLVCERDRSPLPDWAFKVGESTVEVGAYYLSDVIGLREHLERDHLEKLGLRFFYGDDDGLSGKPEFGVARYLPAKSYQIDRGSLEQHLRGVVADAGAELVEGVSVTDIDLGEGEEPHTVHYRGGDGGDGEGGERAVTCRWVVDATGRRRLLQRKLGLAAKSSRRHNAVWFRLGGRLDVDAAVDPGSAAWHGRVEQSRWNSTNHIMFEGGWIWFIPLAPDSTSVGIVTTAQLHPAERVNRIEKALDFVAERVPELEKPLRSLPVLDFHVLKDYSHSTRQAFSAGRWACVGDAAVFVDPFYSVGSNIIAYANGFTVKLITDDAADRLDGEFVHHANRWLLSLTETLTNNIQGAYPFYDNAVIMALKTIWDFYIGWSFSDPQYYAGTYLSAPASASLSGLGAHAVATQASITGLFSEWARRYRGVFRFEFIDYLEDLPTLARLFVQNLPDGAPPPFGTLLARIRDGLDRIEELAHVVFYLALEDALPEHAERIRAHGWLNTSAISLDPERWERDGLFAPGSTPRPAELAALEKEMRSLFR